jgi:hypothetical protein
MLKVNPLTDKKQKWGMIRFTQDGKEHTFYSCVNRLTDDRLSAFDKEPPSIDDTLSWVRSVFRDIRKKAQVIEFIGDF